MMTPSPEQSVRVLVLEDDESLGTMVATYLRTAGIDVVVAVDGEAAWQSLNESSPDVLVADLMVPRLSGDELVGKVRGDARFRNLPIIAMSASLNGAEQAAQMCKILDVDYAFAKPLQLKLLLQTVLGLALGVGPVQPAVTPETPESDA